MTADIHLLVVGEQMELDSMAAKHIADVFSVADEFVNGVIHRLEFYGLFSLQTSSANSNVLMLLLTRHC